MLIVWIMQTDNEVGVYASKELADKALALREARGEWGCVYSREVRKEL